MSDEESLYKITMVDGIHTFANNGIEIDKAVRFALSSGYVPTIEVMRECIQLTNKKETENNAKEETNGY